MSLPLLCAVAASGAPRMLTLPGRSPLVTLRFVFQTGAAHDPADKPGTAALTASMLAEGGTREMTYKQIVEAMFPMATGVSAQVDKEMTTFSAVTHADNLEAFYKLFSAMLLDPGWRADDLQRLRDDQINYLRVSLRGNNDEELGKEVLYNEIHQGTAYGRHNAGTVSSLKAIGAGDLKAFYRAGYTQANLTIGLAGGYPGGFPDRVRKDFSRLPAGTAADFKLPAPARPKGTRVVMVEKQTRSVAYSIGFPIAVRRGHPDYPALLVAQSCLGQHRMSGGRLYNRMREARGLNYGDYAYIEYFPNGMFQFEPSPNLGRRQQIFQIWIRPVEPPTAVFALRLAMYELDRFVREGLTKEEFERTRSFLTKYVNLLTKTKRAELGYEIDSRYYAIPGFGKYVRDSLATLTLEDVNQAIRRHLRTDDLHIAVVAGGCEDLKRKLLSSEPSPMKYISPKPDDILKEDRTVASWKLGLRPENVRIVPVEQVFE